MNTFSKTAVGLAFLGLATASTAHAGRYDNHQRWFDVVNDGGSRIVEVYATHVDYGGWGPNLLDRPVRPGQAATVTPSFDQGYCRFDILIVHADGNRVRRNGVNLCEVQTVAVSGDGVWIA